MTGPSAPARELPGLQRPRATRSGPREQPAWTAFVTCVDLTEPRCRVALCPAPLPARRTAYCSDRHAREFERNHLWFVARRVARRRARYRCERCGFEPSAIRRDPSARASYTRHELKLEVNHVAPLVGAYRLVTCANHQDNLEVLCHRCHLVATAEQRANRVEAAAPGTT